MDGESALKACTYTGQNSTEKSGSIILPRVGLEPTTPKFEWPRPTPSDQCIKYNRTEENKPGNIWLIKKFSIRELNFPPQWICRLLPVELRRRVYCRKSLWPFCAWWKKLFSHLWTINRISQQKLYAVTKIHWKKSVYLNKTHHRRGSWLIRKTRKRLKRTEGCFTPGWETSSENLRKCLQNESETPWKCVATSVPF